LVNPYNAVHYITHAKAQTHPDHLGALAALFGMRPAPASRCRVLEVGCGSGGNLIAMGVGLPDSEFVGIDLASDPIAEGQRTIAALGLRNVRLLTLDLMDIDAEFGSFDYVIAFGVFSWVPAAVRRKLLDLCAAQLAPQGIAFINYNAYPGFHLRAVARDLLRFHIAGIDDPEQAIGQAVALADTTLGIGMRDGEYGASLCHELDEIKKQSPDGIFHDTLAPENTAFYLHEFAGMLREHGLQYLAEAEFFTMQESIYGQPVREALRPFAADRIRKEQYLDFLRGRRFRQSLICHAGVPLEAEANAAYIRDLVFSCPARPDEEGRFRRALGVPIKPVHPLARAALLHMVDVWPRRLRFDEVRTGCAMEGDADDLADILLGCYSVGVIEAHASAPVIAVEPGARPRASPLARLQFADGTVAVNLHHKLVQIEEEEARRLVRMLDGTRGRGELAREFEISDEELGARLQSIGRVALLLE
jgi:SAM-dependent methyltransferase